MSISTIWHIPYGRNRFFTGREEVLTQLHNALQTDTRVALSHPQGISGLGGIGKTQTALEYAYRYRADYDAIFWVRADSVTSLTSGLVELAHVLELPECNEQDQEIIVQATLRWFRLHSDWLLIYDNIDDLSVAEPFLPKAGVGHLIFTTRAHALNGLAQRLDIQKMEPEVGALFLLHRASLLALQDALNIANPDDQNIACAISQELDGLPLALDQAGAYIKETPCPLPDYLTRYQTRRSNILGVRGSFDQDYPASVATTWSLSFEKVREANAAAADLLRFCAFLAPDAIPETMITQGATYLPSILQKVVVHPLQFDRAISSLLAYSLLHRETSNETVSVHRLVQAVLRENTPTKKQPSRSLAQMIFQRQAPVATQKDWKRCAAQVVNATAPNVMDPQQWDASERWLPHSLACMVWLEEKQITISEVPFLTDAGVYLSSRARYREAEPLCERALAISEQQVGPNHPLTATKINNLGELYLSQGKYIKAEPLLERAQAILEQRLGSEHPYTVTNLNNLANLYMYKGEYAKAEPLLRRTLELREQKLGAEPSQMMESLSNLASLYKLQGKYAEAEQLLEQAMQVSERHLEAKLIQTGASLNNQVNLYHSQGKYAEAELLSERALTINEQILGDEHPFTANSLNHLALLYHSQGKYAEAESLCMRALAIREQKLGTEHPDTATSLNNLAELYRDQKKYAEAEPLYQRALSINEQKMGANHPDTALSLNNLALLYDNQGKYAEAEPLYVRALAIREQKLGTEHPDTANSLNNLASLYDSQGKYAEAEPLLERALSINEQRQGANHPDTANSLNNLAKLYRDQGKYAEAEPLYVRALAIREQKLGSEHPDTANSLNNLAKLYRDQGKYVEAEPLYVRALAIREQELGASHPNTAISLYNLATLYKAQERYKEAESFYQRVLVIDTSTYGAEHLEVATDLNSLAALYYAQGEYAKAEPLLVQVLAINEKIYGADHPKTVTSLNNLADLYRHQRKYAEAGLLYLRAIAIDEKVYGVDRTEVATDLNNLATLYDTQGKYTQAELLYQRALEIYELQLGAEHPYTQIVRGSYAALLQTKDRFDKFTDRARNVLSLAQEEARVFQHNYIGTEHLLLGLVRESEGIVAKVLSNLGIELNKVRGIVEFIIDRRDHIAQDEIGLTPHAKKVIEFAEEEALYLNHQYIEAEHLLLGLIREAEGIAAGILESIGVNLEKLREQTISILSKSE